MSVATEDVVTIPRLDGNESLLNRIKRNIAERQTTVSHADNGHFDYVDHNDFNS